ncbi:MAG: BREX-3 system phosphatase PglZ [Armatimonadetes bacterium]|nr:BREX-3 system phosphatase PglZ [Armatimonadota bacterium]
MSGQRRWHSRILPSFTPELAALRTSAISVVADPDELFSDELLAKALWESGFDVVPSRDPIETRLRYEHVRAALDDGSNLDRALVLTFSLSEEVGIPYDIAECARLAGRFYNQWTIAAWLKSLDPVVARTCGVAMLDEVLAADAGCTGPTPPEDTANLLLEDVYALHLPDRADPARLLTEVIGWLLAGGRALPGGPVLDGAVRRCIASVPDADWQTGLSDPSAFWTWFDTVWGAAVTADTVASALRSALSDHRLWLVMDDAFDRGLLRRRVPVVAESYPPDWSAGLLATPDATSLEISTLIAASETALPGEDATADDWAQFMPIYAGAVAETIRIGRQVDSALVDRVNQLRARADQDFSSWIRGNYRFLHTSASPSRPRLIYRVLDSISRRRESAQDRSALVVVDGMSWFDWTIIRDSLLDAFGDRVSEGSTLALVPTITSVSRAALLSGSSRPMEATDQKRFSAYWAEQGLSVESSRALVQGGSSIETFARDVAVAAGDPRVRIIAAVVSDVDEMMHGSKYRSTHAAQIREWMGRGSFIGLLSGLLDQGFEVTVTSDHGGTSSVGVGRPNVGSMSSGKGARALTGFVDLPSAKRVEQLGFDCVYWGPDESGLGEAGWAVLAVSGQSFQPKGAESISHGGITPEEVIVPLVTIRR